MGGLVKMLMNGSVNWMNMFYLSIVPIPVSVVLGAAAAFAITTAVGFFHPTITATAALFRIA